MVTIIGAAGHVGLPLSLVLADAGFDVVGIDHNLELVETLRAGVVPYVEEGAEALLKSALERGNLTFTDSADSIATSDVLVVIIGTPIDENLNPRIDPLINIFTKNAHQIHRGQLIVLRSTVSPGTTELVRSTIEELTGLKEGEDFFLVFAPERVLQTKAIHEIRSLPQLIGARTQASFDRASAFFERFIDHDCVQLTPTEAEIGKLVTNMARYVSFALANEFYIIGDYFDVNMHKIISACNHDYPRLNLPRPGPNVGGPCLYKDGYYLIEKIPFPEIIATSFKINESIPMYLLEKVRAMRPVRKAGILGMTFKANCDDTRNSLSFKLRKQLKGIKCEVIEVDPYLPLYADFERLAGVDALFLMTPHREFRDLRAILDHVGNPECVVVDMWNFWDENQDLSPNGIYYANAINDSKEVVV